MGNVLWNHGNQVAYCFDFSCMVEIEVDNVYN